MMSAPFEPLNTLSVAFSQAVLDRATIFLNHVLSAEPAAPARLQPHAGRSLALHWRHWPALLPAPPVAAWVVTPAGLLERAALSADAATLRVALDAADLGGWWQAWQGGQLPPMDIQGDAAFAADVNWLIAHVRWDVEDDLARVIGDLPAHQLVSMGRAIAQGLRRFTGSARDR